MIFKSLEAMLGKDAALVLTLARGEGENLTVAVCPKGEFKNGALGLGLTLTATAQELDREFVDALVGYQAKRRSLREQVEAAELVLAEAGKSITAKAAAAVAKSAATTPGAKKGTPAPAPAQAEPADSGSSADAKSEAIDLF